MSHASSIRLWLEADWCPGAVIGATPRECMERAHRLSGLDMGIDDFVASMLEMQFNPRTRGKEDRWVLDLPNLTRNTDHFKLES